MGDRARHCAIGAVVVALVATGLTAGGIDDPGSPNAAAVADPPPSAAAARVVQPSARVRAVLQHGRPGRAAMLPAVTPAQARAAAAAPFNAVEHIAVIILTFPDRPTFSLTTGQVRDSMATLDAYIREVSYGKRSVVSTIVGPFRASFNSCSGDNVREGLKLADPSVDYRNFDSFYVIFSDFCTGASGSVFQNDVWPTEDGDVRMGWAQANVNDNASLVWRYAAHEFGHNQGLGHADYLQCGSDSIRDDNLSNISRTPSGGGCQWLEYFDRFDVMGLGGYGNQYNAPHKAMLGFFDPSLGPERLQDVTASGTYTIGLLETRGAETKALRIPRRVGPNGQENLWVEYRQPVGFDATLDASKLDGVFIHVDNMIPSRSVDTLIVDPTPTGNGDSDVDAVLRLNQTFSDKTAGYSITLVGRTATTATVRIDRQLSCAPTSQALRTQNVTFKVSGGGPPYNWSAPGGTPASGSGSTFTTKYSTAGVKTLTVSSPNSSANGQCTTNVLASGWSGWIRHDGSLLGPPALVQFGSGRYDVFARGSDNTLQHRWIVDSTGFGWEDLGGSIAGDPAAVSWGPGRIDVLARGTDGKLKHIAWDGNAHAWTGWKDVSRDVVRGTPAVVTFGPNHLDVYWRNGANALRHATFDGTRWSGATRLTTGLASDPAAISWSPGRVDVFWRGSGDRLMHRGGSGASGTIDTLATNLGGKPAVETWAAGRIDVVWRGTDDRAYQMAFENRWWPAQDLGGILTADPAVVSRSVGDLEVFVRGVGNGAWYQVYKNGWPGWHPLGGSLAGPPATISIASNLLGLVAVGGDGALNVDTFVG